MTCLAQNQRGFIALTSAVILAATLLVIVVAGSISGFYERQVMLDAELKERSAAAADACAQKVFLYLESAHYAGGTYQLNALDWCRVGEVTQHGLEASFKVQATSNSSAVTNLLVTYKPLAHEAVSYEEVPNY